MEDAGFADEVPGIVGEEVALARHHRRCDRALVAADDRVHPEREAIARLIDGRAEALAPAGVARGRYEADRPQRRADGADAGEKRVPGEIVSARQRRARGRQEARLERDEIAGRHIGRSAGRHPDAARNLLSRHAVGGVDADHHARADGPEVDFLDKALERDDADAVEHWSSDPRRAQRHRQEPGEQRGYGQRQPERQRPGATEPRERAEESDHQRRQPQDGLPVGRQIGRDASHRRDRNPKEEAPLLDLAREGS